MPDSVPLAAASSPLWQLLAGALLSGGGLAGLYGLLYGQQRRLSRQEQQVVGLREQAEELAKAEREIREQLAKLGADSRRDVDAATERLLGPLAEQVAGVTLRISHLEAGQQGIRERLRAAERTASHAVPRETCDERHGRMAPVARQPTEPDSQDGPLGGRGGEP